MASLLLTEERNSGIGRKVIGRKNKKKANMQASKKDLTRGKRKKEKGK